MRGLIRPLAEIFAAVEDVRKVWWRRQFNLRFWRDDVHETDASVGRRLNTTSDAA
jgi:hypothetical protein